MRTCNLCGFPILRLHPGPAGRRCVRCLSTFRHRAVGAVLRRLGLGREAHVYELSSRGALCRHLRRIFQQVYLPLHHPQSGPGPDQLNGLAAAER